MVYNMANGSKKVVNISGICTNCDNERVCDFIREFKAFIRDRKCANKILDTEITVYSCDKYESAKEVCSSDGVCLHCRQES